MVEVQYYGGLGNNLFQYALGRIIAEHLGFAMRCVPKGPLGSLGDFGTVARHFKDCRLILPGQVFHEPREEYSIFEATPFNGYVVDLEDILSNPRGRHIVLGGIFQQVSYYERHAERIREWFSLEPVSNGYQVSVDDIVVSVRRGDSLRLGWSVQLDYYGKILDSAKFDRVFVCGDEIDREVCRYFARYSPIYFRASPIEQLSFMTSFNKIVQSHSTFSWWAAYLSDASEVYTPRPLHGPWSPDDPNVDLEVDDSRYRYIDDVKTIRANLATRVAKGLKRRLGEITRQIRLNRSNPAARG